MYSRREFGQLLMAGIPLSLLLRLPQNTVVNGVRLGAITYSFHDMPNVVGQDHVDAVITDCHGCGVGLLELMSNHVEPVSEFQARRGAFGGAGGRPASSAAPAAPASSAGAAPPSSVAGGARGRSPEAQKAREDLRQWRLTTPMSHFEAIKRKLNDAGIVVYAYTVNGMGADFTDEEIDKMFEQAKTLGAVTIASSTTLDVAQKLVPFVEKHQFPVAFHNHDDIVDPNQFATPQSFYKAMAMSNWFRINLDIGYITGSNVDAVAFIEKNHDRITHLHVKDRKRNLGPSVPWGEGDTPIKQVLTLLKTNHYPMPALVELSYPVPPDSDCTKEVAKCMAYMKAALA
ncbi:MAG TPA: TIM barrel protein [Candidatus Aquilonibacter sp.]|nr:TIM barrel protein [Candidatus Aquilonibacter sp.]